MKDRLAKTIGVYKPSEHPIFANVTCVCDVFLGVRQAAKKLDVDQKTIYNWLDKGKLKATTINDRIFFPEAYISAKVRKSYTMYLLETKDDKGTVKYRTNSILQLASIIDSLPKNQKSVLNKQEVPDIGIDEADEIELLDTERFLIKRWHGSNMITVWSLINNACCYALIFVANHDWDKFKRLILENDKSHNEYLVTGRGWKEVDFVAI
jgi:hypothetical protein